MKAVTKTVFDRITFQNRWKIKKWARNCDWVVVGIQQWYVGPLEFCYKFCFFGFDLKIWLKRIAK